jgi:hypothetical protein
MAGTKRESMFRERRAAKNQSLFREVNERIEGLNEAFSLVNPINDFVCECAAETCVAQIALSMAEYESLRRHPNRFAVIPDDGHVWPDVESVVERNARYWVVEKTGFAGAMATSLDPRAGTAGTPG